MEFMSNISSGIDDNKPSLFELVSEQQLRDLLEPSVRYLLAIITQRHPRYLIHIVNRFDEAYALLMLLVERHYLKAWNGSFTENFYGIKRERVLTVNDLPSTSRTAAIPLREATKLGELDSWKALFVIVGVPYIKRKLDDLYEIHAGGAAQSLFTNYRPREEELDENATTTERVMHKMKIGFRKAYPVINAAYYLSMLGFNLAYLFNKTHYHTPFDFLVGLRMRRLTEADHRAYEALKSKNRRPGLAPILTWWTMFSPKVFSRVILPKLLDSLKVLLPTSIFFLKFLEWWYASDFARQLSSKSTAAIELSRPSVPAPPPAEGKRKEASMKLVELPKDSKICPICKNEMTNPAAIQTGFVFCYPCVYRWIEEDGGPWCPITGAKLLGGSEGLRRIMV
ncbi:hypothetical protein ABW20_dc0109027 [Dactylellina cionopaga]|nr:hypothetical protein ABW20_dc0109027 [Dactylellina cionopaga]